jgi:cyclophilin family peptidyl-prolyl cis-trans isomerase
MVHSMIKNIVTAAALALALAACAPANRDAGTTGDATGTGGTNGTTASATAANTTMPTNPAATTTATIPPVPATANEERPMSYYENKVAEIHTSAGEIDIRFFPDVAPNHVKNFIDLAEKGFYNGTKFHRVIPGFMIQGGDPNTVSGDPSTWGTGGSGKHVSAEFNKVHHARGIVSMARAQDPNSASSQFFIVVADAGFLDNQYSVFGQVTKGMEVADTVVNAPRNAQDRPNEPTMIQKIVVRDAKPEERGPAPTGK